MAFFGPKTAVSDDDDNDDDGENEMAYMTFLNVSFIIQEFASGQLI